MSPLSISMLLHYYCTGSSDFQYWSGDFIRDMPPAVLDAFDAAVEDETLARVNNGNPDAPHYRIASRGAAYIEALTRVPLPEYRMPAGLESLGAA